MIVAKKIKIAGQSRGWGEIKMKIKIERNED
jgi:hypothetical protein